MTRCSLRARSFLKNFDKKTSECYHEKLPKNSFELFGKFTLFKLKNLSVKLHLELFAKFMMSDRIKKLLIVTFLLPEISSLCQEFHIVICDNLDDVKVNETNSWRYVQIGSSGYRTDQPKEVLTRSFFFNLKRTKAVTIINRLSRLNVPFLPSYYETLTYLNLYDNDIIEIDDNTFEILHSLKEIYLENNRIQHLGQGLFKDMNLEIVNLSRNRLRSITTAFYFAKIDCILLNNNEISYIKSAAFPTKLKQLELNNNLLEVLEDRVFQDLPELQELFIKNNRLTTLPNFVDLKEIQYLHLSFNKLKKVDYSFNDHLKLDFIDLSSNIIENVTVDAFSSTKIPPLVLLAFNRLTNIVFEHPEKKTDLVLYGNPWSCDCLFTIEKTIKQHKHMTTCEVNLFDKGDIPLCIENGKCGVVPITNSEINNFQTIVRGCEDEIYKYCNFRL